MTYVIEGDPIAWARARYGAQRRFYDSQAAQKLSYGIQLTKQHDSSPLDGALRLDIKFVMPIPPSRKKFVREGDYHFYKPDCSNLIKFIEDAATKILYNDDCLIAQIIAAKIYGEKPRTEFTLVKL